MSDREFSRLPSAAQRRFDRGFRLAAACAASLAVLTVIVIVIEITRMAAPAVSRYGSDLITSTSYDKNREEFGLLPAIWGTIYTSILALGLATLFGVTAAIVLTEDYLPVRLRSVLAQTIQLLAAIPSVIYGLWGIHVLIPMLRPPANWLHEHSPAWLPFFNTEFTGFSILTCWCWQSWCCRRSPR